MRVAFKIIKNIFFLHLYGLKNVYNLSKLSVHNLTCQFDISSEIVNSSFGKYVVIFDSVKIDSVKIDSYSYIQAGSRIFNCSIGKFCSIAASVSIAPGIHDVHRVSTHPALVQKSTPLPKVFAKSDNIVDFKSVIIGNDVWIGEKAVILDGITVGTGSVIASGAVVVKDVAPYSIVGGIPAKHIKYRFDEETIILLLQSNWWDNNEEWFEKNAEFMLDIDKFITYLKCTKE